MEDKEKPCDHVFVMADETGELSKCVNCGADPYDEAEIPLSQIKINPKKERLN